MKRRTIHVTDTASDDFGLAGKHLVELVIDEHYKYRHNMFWHLLSNIVYYIMGPLPLFAVKVAFGIRFQGRRRLLATGGCYMYSNHSNWYDAIIPYLITFPRRAYVVAGPTAMSVPLVRHLVPMLGAIPLNRSRAGKAAFRQALSAAVHRGGFVAIMPEAHVWPYFTDVRDFTSYSFTYPVHADSTVVPYVVTYRRRPILRWRPPHPTVMVGDPIEPGLWRDSPDPKQTLRDAVHEYMKTTLDRERTITWIDYEIPAKSRPDE